MSSDNNLIDLANMRRVLEGRKKITYQAERDLAQRLDNIKASINRINSLMEELRDMRGENK